MHRNVPSTPAAVFDVVAPYRADVGVAGECLFTWYWVADRGAAEGIVFGLGHALAMQAIHGGKAQNDQLDSPKVAVLLRGGMLPQAYGYPAARRATRFAPVPLASGPDRGQLLAHRQNTRAPYNLAAFEKRLAYPANRTGVLARFADPPAKREPPSVLGAASPGRHQIWTRSARRGLA